MNAGGPLKAQLTRRELEVLSLVAGGCRYSQVALRLGISLNTVVTHIRNTYRKLEAPNGAAAVMRAVQLGLLEV